MSGALTQSEHDLIRELVRKESGIQISADQQYLITSRLEALITSHKYSDHSELMTKVRENNRAAVDDVVEALTTNETLFFRDFRPFGLLKDVFIPELIEAGRKTINIWSCACSTGQEAYSMAMTILENHWPQVDFDILGTDISKEVVEKAKAAVYLQIDVNRGLPKQLLNQYFSHVDGKWEACQRLRSLADFRLLNLMDPVYDVPPKDIVFLRNVLIYFDVETKSEVIRKIAKCLKPGGVLLLGTVDTSPVLDELFEKFNSNHIYWYRLR